MTDRQAAAYAVIKAYFGVVGEGCPVAIVARKLLISETAARYHVIALERKHWLMRPEKAKKPVPRRPWLLRTRRDLVAFPHLGRRG